jgi:ribosomal protein L28
MSKTCQITQKKTITVNHVSHSNRKVKSKSKANVSYKNIDVEFTESFVRLNVSNAGRRAVEIKNGIARYLLSKSRRELTPLLNKLRKIVIHNILSKNFSDNPTLSKVQELLKNSKSGRKFPSKLCRLKKMNIKSL